MLKKLENLLKKNKAKYKLISHRTVFTAYDAAATQHIDVKAVAKTLLIKADKDYVLVVLSGNKRLDLVRLKKAVNLEKKKINEKLVKKLSFCSEIAIKKQITGKVGALTAFGSIYGLKTYVDKSLLKQKKLNLNAGSFEESLEMTAAQYKKIEKPVEGSFGK